LYFLAKQMEKAMYQLSETQRSNIGGGLLDPFLGIGGIDAGLTFSGVLGAVGMAASAGWWVGSEINKYYGDDINNFVRDTIG
jgi:hypothetical protein